MVMLLAIPIIAGLALHVGSAEGSSRVSETVSLLCQHVFTEKVCTGPERCAVVNAGQDIRGKLATSALLACHLLLSPFSVTNTPFNLLLEPN